MTGWRKQLLLKEYESIANQSTKAQNNIDEKYLKLQNGFKMLNCQNYAHIDKIFVFWYIRVKV